MELLILITFLNLLVLGLMKAPSGKYNKQPKLAWKSPQTYGQWQLIPTGKFEVEYKRGDLVRLSDFGLLVSGDKGSDVGVVVDGPYNLLTPTNEEVTTYYIAYDILVDGEILKRIPVDFLRRMTTDERDIERVEKIPKRNKGN